jgi:hypothetical protein
MHVPSRRSVVVVPLLVAACWWVCGGPDARVDALRSDLEPPAQPPPVDFASTWSTTRFVPNRGQWHGDVRFVAQGFTLRFERWSAAAPTDGAARPRSCSGGVVRTRFVDCHTKGVATGDVLPLRTNWLCGADPAAFATDVPSYETVQLRDVQPGIDVVFRPLAGGASGPFEYDLMLAPGADLGAFRARCDGAAGLEVDAAGRLCIAVPTPSGIEVVVQERPIAWHETTAGRRALEVAFVLHADGSYGFVAPDRDPRLAAVVDPGVVWSSYLGGGSSDSINDVVWRPGAGIWLAGWAGSTDFPTTVGAYRTTGGQDGFVAKLNDAGTQVLFATYLGGSLGDEIRGLALGPGDSIAVGGFTASLNFPVTAGALQPTYAGASLVLAVGDAFVARLSANGSSLLASTYLGGGFDESVEAIDVGPTGNVYAVGWTASGNFPTTPGVWRPTLGGPLTLQSDGFVANLAPDLRTANWSTYAGGGLPDQFNDVDVNPATGQVTAVGWSVSVDFPVTGLAHRTIVAGVVDMVACRLNANGTAPVWSTYIGGADSDIAHCLQVAGDGSCWIGGSTRSPNFPVSAGAPQTVFAGETDGVVCRLSANGQALPYATLVGGPDFDAVRDLDVVGSDVLAVGEAGPGLSVTANAFQPLFGGGNLDGFAVWFSGNGTTRDYCSYFGGAGQDVLGSVDFAAGGLAVLGGWSFSSAFPTTPGVVQRQLRGIEDGVVLQLDLLSDLVENLELVAESVDEQRFVDGGDVELLRLRVGNPSARDIELRSLRFLLAGHGDGVASARDLRLFVGAVGVPESERLAAAPIATVVENAELAVPLLAVHVPAGGAVVLRVVVGLLADAAGRTVELAGLVAEASALEARAFGAGEGLPVRVQLTGRGEGPVWVVGNLPGDADGDRRLTVGDLRRQCIAVGTSNAAIDCDGDLVQGPRDVAITLDAMLGRPTLVSQPSVLARGAWFTLPGVFPSGRAVTATLAGRSLTIGRVTPREVTLRCDAVATGLQELLVAVDGTQLVSGLVTVQ